MLHSLSQSQRKISERCQAQGTPDPVFIENVPVKAFVENKATLIEPS